MIQSMARACKLTNEQLAAEVSSATAGEHRLQLHSNFIVVAFTCMRTQYVRICACMWMCAYVRTFAPVSIAIVKKRAVLLVNNDAVPNPILHMNCFINECVVLQEWEIFQSKSFVK